MNQKGFKDFSVHLHKWRGSFGKSYFFMFSALFGLALLSKSIYYGKSLFILVDVGHFAIKFNKFKGLSPERHKEGYNFKIPII
jgi:hypothetical protein